MNNDTSTIEKAFSTKDIAIMVGIAEPTVRKYSQALEKSGYTFIKGKNGSRIFVEYDAMVLRYLKELREKTNMSVEKSSEVVVAKYKKTPIQDESLPDTPKQPQYEIRYTELEEQLKQQKEMIKQLVEKVNEHDKEFDRVSQRDKLLMETMKEMQETKKLLLESKQKKSWFTRLFSR